MEKKRKIVLFGEREFAEIAYEYFTHDSEYEVAAFTIEREYITKTTFCGLPVIPFEGVPLLSAEHRANSGHMRRTLDHPDGHRLCQVADRFPGSLARSDAAGAARGLDRGILRPVSR